MAIARPVRPTVIAAGIAVKTGPLKTKDGQREYADEILLAQDNGAQIAVQVYRRDGNPGTPIPSIGTFWACEASVSESREYGASLSFEAAADAALDRLMAVAR